MASTTAKAESSQAYFMYIADMLGDAKTKTLFEEFIKKASIAKNNNDKEGVVGDFFNNEHIKKVLYNKNNKQQNQTTSKAVKTTVNLPSCIAFLKTNIEWFISSMKIAKKFISDVHMINGTFRGIQKLDWQDLYYKRGDADVMKKIETIFKVVNKNQGNVFGDINKWSTADMYVASKTAKDKINELNVIKNEVDFETLNLAITELIKSGDIIPISLKKVVKGEVKLLKVNFNPNKEKQYINSLKFGGFKPSKQLNSKGNFSIDNSIAEILKKLKDNTTTKDKIIRLTKSLNDARSECFMGSLEEDKDDTTPPDQGGRDVVYKVNRQVGKIKTELGEIQFRHTTHSLSNAFKGKISGNGVKATFRYKGSGAQDGQIASIDVFINIIKKNSPSNSPIKQFTNALNSSWTSNMPEYESAFKEFMIKLYNLLVKQKEFSEFTKEHTANTLPVWPNNYRGEDKNAKELRKELAWWTGALSAVHLMNIVKEKCFKLDKTWWKTPNGDTITRRFFQYATARTNDGKIQSSKYVLFKD